MTFIVY